LYLAVLTVVIVIIIVYFTQLYKGGLFINLKHGICDSSVLNFCYCYWDINFLVRWQLPIIIIIIIVVVVVVVVVVVFNSR
jgi:hypothetical protein